jgi:hypothetical protein
MSSLQQILELSCPVCAAQPGNACHMKDGAPRISPPLNRRLCAGEARSRLLSPACHHSTGMLASGDAVQSFPPSVQSGDFSIKPGVHLGGSSLVEFSPVRLFCREKLLLRRRPRCSTSAQF